MDPIATYIPQDRREALAQDRTLPDRAVGSALFVDISGFTALTEHLTLALGPRHGAEELTRHLNAVYDALIVEVERYGGSVLGFAGDAITCWFDDMYGDAAHRAVSCANAMQSAIRQFSAIALPGGMTSGVAHKVAVASGPARRFVVGDPEIQLIDTLAGATVARAAVADHLADGGEVLVDAATAAKLEGLLEIVEWREEPTTSDRFAVVRSLLTAGNAEPSPRPEYAQRWSLSAEVSRAWLYPAVYEREQAGQGSFLAEFRPVVVLFLRFSGLDYEHDKAGQILDEFIHRSQAIVMKYEGTLLALTIGDKGSYFYPASATIPTIWP